MKILAFRGSPRTYANSTLLLHEFIRGAQDAAADVSVVDAHGVNIQPCRGCLKCNLLKRCAIRKDDWPALADQILHADCLVFATPVYFHHVPGPLKIIIDRFRSFMHVRITETGLQHTPWHEWKKKFVAIMTLGSSSTDDTLPLIDLFRFIVRELGTANEFLSIIGTRLAVAKQITMPIDSLRLLYPKLDLPASLASHDYERNQKLLRECYTTGKHIASL